MSEVTSPVILDSTGMEIADAIRGLTRRRVEIATLDATELAVGTVIEAVGVPHYVEDPETFSGYGISESGWYIFARIYAGGRIKVTADTQVTGAAGVIQVIGEDHVDIAVRFGVAAESVKVTVNWGSYVDSFIFRATDLAVRNLDYRATAYVYELAPFATWEYRLTASTTFSSGKKYFVRDGEGYAEAEVTAGETVPAVYYERTDEDEYTPTADATFEEGKDYYTLSGGSYAAAAVTAGETVPTAYYEHSKLCLEGMIKNVTYRMDEEIDCGIEITLPEIGEDGHGAWFEFQFRHVAAYSITLLPPEGVKGATAGASAAISAGLNVVDLHYTDVAGTKMWSLANVHTSIPS